MSIEVNLPKKVVYVEPTGEGHEVVEWHGYEVTAKVSGMHGLLYIDTTRWAVLVPYIYLKAWCECIVHAFKYD